MRLTKGRLKSYKMFKHEAKVTDEGGRIQGYSDSAKRIEAIIWPANGRVQAEVYGTRLAYMMNMLCHLDVAINEHDGIAVFSKDKPDYKVISIKRWSEHLEIELEAIRGGKS